MATRGLFEATSQRPMLQQQTLSNKAAPQTGSTVVNMGYGFTRGTGAHKLYALLAGS